MGESFDRPRREARSPPPPIAWPSSPGTQRADVLEVDAADLRLSGGGFAAAGSRKEVVSLAELAGRTGGFSAREIFEVDTMTYPCGIHLAHVEVDPDSGGVRILGYFIGYEVGRAIVPALVEGQLVGGAAQGIAGALLEEFRYTDDGQPLSTTLADYLLPTAGEVPPIGVLISEDWPGGEQRAGRSGRRRRRCNGAAPRSRRRWTMHSVARARSARCRSHSTKPAGPATVLGADRSFELGPSGPRRGTAGRTWCTSSTFERRARRACTAASSSNRRTGMWVAPRPVVARRA